MLKIHSPWVSDPLEIHDVPDFLFLEVLSHLSQVERQGENVFQFHQLNRILSIVGLTILWRLDKENAN
jgi:hypothetical protein